LIIEWHWVAKAKKDHEDERQKPDDGVENKNEGHDSDGDSENKPALPSEKSVSNMATIQLANWKQIESSNEKSNPPGKSNGMKKDLVTA
jgi:hypothetical protein